MAPQTPASPQPAELNPEQQTPTAAHETVDTTDILAGSTRAEVTVGESRMEELQGAMIESQVFEPKPGNTLRRRLLLTLMPTTIIPLVIAGFLGFQAEKDRAQSEALSLLKEESVLAADAAADFVQDGFKIPGVVAASPNVQQALQNSKSLVATQKLADQEIGDLESRFAETKLLSSNPTLNQYLSDLSNVEAAGEIFFTESNGFNIAYSRPTPDFVQKDERWWRTATAQGIHIGPPELDRTANQMGVSLSKAIKDDNGQILGVIKALVSTTSMDKRIQASIASSAVGASQAVQIVDARTGIPFNLIEPDGASSGGGEIIGGSSIAALALALEDVLGQPDQSVDVLKATVEQATNIAGFQLERLESPTGEEILTALADIGAKKYSLTTIPGTNWMAIASVDISEVESAGDELIRVFVTSTAILSLAAAVVLLLLANQLSSPLKSLTTTAEEATAGNLDIRADLQGTVETQTLGQVFNTLLNQIQALLTQQQQAAAEQQTLREELEEDISLLMEDISDAADGDLRVRAKLTEGDVGIIADLFNAIIENLRLTTIQVKSSTGEVTSSLAVNEAAIRELAEQAIDEAQSLKETMEAVEDISGSIQEVATNAGQASRLTKDTYTTVQAGTESMDKTVESILGLRSTVGETAKKIKRLGESAQKISQAVGLIDEIALKTNLLAVNASVEAARAGEMGQGFTAVAEQVGSLAEQSSSATKEIAQIVASIQNETQEVVESIETGTAQVVNSTNLVENTKRRLAEVLLKSEQINELMQKISASTSYQTESSAAVTALVKQATEESEQRSESSSDMAQAIQATASIARELQASVEQFKVDEATVDPSLNDENGLNPPS